MNWTEYKNTGLQERKFLAGEIYGITEGTGDLYCYFRGSMPH